MQEKCRGRVAAAHADEARLSLAGRQHHHDDPYDSSWLIFPERWTAIAEKLQGDLLVAAPGVDTLVYGNGTADDSVAALGKAAAIVAAKTQKPLSTAVFRWTPTGWVEAKP
jgi:hypothetical protein